MIIHDEVVLRDRDQTVNAHWQFRGFKLFYQLELFCNKGNARSELPPPGATRTNMSRR